MLNDASKIVIGSVSIGALIGFVLLVVLLGPLITWWLFNYLAPIFNFRQIHFTEAIALYILTNFLTGGFYRNCKSNGK